MHTIHTRDIHSLFVAFKDQLKCRASIRYSILAIVSRLQYFQLVIRLECFSQLVNASIIFTVQYFSNVIIDEAYPQRKCRAKVGCVINISLVPILQGCWAQPSTCQRKTAVHCPSLFCQRNTRFTVIIYNEDVHVLKHECNLTRFMSATIVTEQRRMQKHVPKAFTP